MASDFPRGWTLSQFASEGTITITVPAIVGITHILDGYDLKAWVLGGGLTVAYSRIISLTSSDGTYNSFPLGAAFFSSTAPEGTEDTSSGSGLDLIPGAGASLTLVINGAVHVATVLRIQGHDI